MNAWMMEDGFILDKLIITTDPNYVPSGSGPDENSRGDPPTVKLTSPRDGDSFAEGETIVLSAAASDNSGEVTLVEFFNGTKLGEDEADPYTVHWNNVPWGRHILKVKATDNDGKTAQDTIEITVYDPNNQPPAVVLSAPSDGAAFSEGGSISLSADAFDSDGVVTKVEFYSGSKKLGEDTSAPYSFTWRSVPAGTYTLMAKAHDEKLASSVSRPVQVLVKVAVPDWDSYRQDAGPNGLVCIEAEHYFVNVSRNGDSWNAVTPAGCSGDGAMEVGPNNGTKHKQDYAANAPRLDYQVYFLEAGTYHVWLRGYGPGSKDRSVHVGLDGAEVPTAKQLKKFEGAWKWSKTRDGGTATITVTTPGIHVINVWMRQDGFVLDKILLTKNASYTPTGLGPDESPKTDVDVLTSGDASTSQSGWNAVDGDQDTMWVGDSGADAWWIVLAYDDIIEIHDIEVLLTGDSLTGALFLASEDGDEWFDLTDALSGGSAWLRYVWIIFPDDGSGAVPEVLEITPL